MSDFDADAFLDQEVDAQFESTYTPVPEDEYPAQIDTVKVKTFKDKETQEQKPFLQLGWSITDADLCAEMGREKVIVQQTVFLDIEDGVFETGANKNIMLGNLREIGGLDGPFSPRQLEGISGIIKVKHRMTDDNVPMAEVKAVTAE